jgi:hypothetical protein
MRRVIHAVPNGTQAFLARSFITGEDAVIVTTPIRDRDKVALRMARDLVGELDRDERKQKAKG